MNAQRDESGQAMPIQPGTSTPTTTESPSAGNPLDSKRTGPPQVPGWTVIPVSDGADLNTDKAYDVPPGWDGLRGRIVFGQENDSVNLFAPAMYKQGFCPAQPSYGRSGAGVAVSNEPDAAKAADEVARQVLHLYPLEPGGPEPTMDVEQAQPVTVAKDRTGYTLNAQATYAQGAGGCGDAKTAAVSVMAMAPAGETSTIVFVAYADQDVPDATDPHELQQIVLSLHNVS